MNATYLEEKCICVLSRKKLYGEQRISVKDNTGHVLSCASKPTLSSE